VEIEVNYNFVEILLQAFVVGGTEVGCFCWRFNAFHGCWKSS
jgi:hypothetical protein